MNYKAEVSLPVLHALQYGPKPDQHEVNSAVRWAVEQIAEVTTIRAELASLRGELAAAKEQRGLLEGYIVDAHFRAFGDRHYAYVDCRSACDLLVADITATQHERDAATAQVADLRAAGEALVQRWDTPGWKDVPHTGVFIDALRAALGRTAAQSLAAHDAALLRKVIEDDSFCEEGGSRAEIAYLRKKLAARADQLEAEAKGNTA